MQSDPSYLPPPPARPKPAPKRTAMPLDGMVIRATPAGHTTAPSRAGARLDPGRRAGVVRQVAPAGAKPVPAKWRRPHRWPYEVAFVLVVIAIVGLVVADLTGMIGTSSIDATARLTDAKSGRYTIRVTSHLSDKERVRCSVQATAVGGGDVVARDSVTTQPLPPGRAVAVGGRFATAGGHAKLGGPLAVTCVPADRSMAASRRGRG